MPDQISLPGLDALPSPLAKTKHRLFLAVMPQPEDAARISAFARQVLAQHGMRSRPLPDWRLHLSLHFLDDYPVIPQPLIASLERAFVALRRPSFAVRFDRVLSFAGPHQRPGQYPMVLASSERSEPLLELYEATGEALRRSGHKVPPVQAFEPHMTLGYDSRIVPEQTVPELSWRARDWVLVHNALKTGRPYEILGRWPLQP